jgi:SAM-dependent methyltransferase
MSKEIGASPIDGIGRTMNRTPADRFRPRWEEVEIRSRLASIARTYPEPLVESQLGSIDRVAFELEIVLRNAPGAGTLCDLGGGIGMFPIACAALGMRTILVDDFQDPVCFEHGQPTRELHKRYGVEVLMRDLVEEGLDLPPETIDVFTIFDSMEHWHHSPKPVFGAVMRALRPGGLFVLSGPNCANLRKRITLLFGRGKWSAMHDWYDAPRFRGHVREPDVEDLRYIARDMDLTQVRILGRNWAGWGSRLRLIRIITPFVDSMLRLRPSLCSDLYLIGNKRA